MPGGDGIRMMPSSPMSFKNYISNRAIEKSRTVLPLRSVDRETFTVDDLLFFLLPYTPSPPALHFLFHSERGPRTVRRWFSLSVCSCSPKATHQGSNYRAALG